MAPTSTDPRVIRSIAVTRSDVVAAYEHNRRGGARAVLRVTPPFNGRMRARIHVEHDAEYADAVRPIHVQPSALVDTDRVPPYPDPDETGASLRADPEATYSVEEHHERHVEAVAAWREAVGDAIVDAVDLATPDGPHRVAVKRLG
ncbi:hypothetical protein ACFQH6_10655 [Halobacteriaceae archaeon GCM10025711]